MDADATTLRPVVREVAIADVLAYRAPFLIDKLVKNRIADSEEEAEALFAEVKKYLVITRSDEDVSWKMYSVRVDEAWHQFILYTEAYTEFCECFFGGYIAHSPGNLPARAELNGSSRFPHSTVLGAAIIASSERTSRRSGTTRAPSSRRGGFSTTQLGSGSAGR